VAKKKGREREGEAKEKRRRRRRERRRRDGEEKGCVDTEKENKVKNRWKRKKTEDHKRTWKKAHNNHHHKQRNFCLRERMEHISGVNTEVETKWECAKREGPQLSGRAWASPLLPSIASVELGHLPLMIRIAVEIRGIVISMIDLN